MIRALHVPGTEGGVVLYVNAGGLTNLAIADKGIVMAAIASAAGEAGSVIDWVNIFAEFVSNV